MYSKTYQKLDSLTEQEVFNIVINHLKEQKEKSSSITGNCRYKFETDEKTLKCAVGVLIEDEDYHEKLEGKTVHNTTIGSLVPKRHFEMLARLQRYHDEKGCISYESYISGEKTLKETLEDYLYHVKEPNFKSLIEEYFNQYPE